MNVLGLKKPQFNAPVVEWALYYGSLGVPVFPVAPRSKHPAIPKARGGCGVKDATTDPSTIKRMWDEIPGANIGAACGFAFDAIDIENEGMEAAHAFGASWGPLVKTPHGGRHAYVKPGSLRSLGNAVKPMPGFDVRTDGGYVVMPPSFVELHEVVDEVSGVVNQPAHDGWYEWLPDHELGVSLPDPPAEFMIEALKGINSKRARQACASPEGVILEGGRNDSLFRYACKLRGSGMSSGEILAALESINASRCRPPLSIEELRMIRDSAATYPAGSSQRASSITEPSSVGSDLDECDSDQAEVRRLAALPEIQRDRELKASAKELGVSVVTIRKEVAKLTRDTGGDQRQGKPLQFDDHVPSPNEIEGADLLMELAHALKTYFALPTYGAETIALWIVHTHLYDCFIWTPKLGLISPEKECGKSLLLDCVSFASRRSLNTGSISTSAMFRVIEAHHPTVVIDEADTISRENEDMRGLLNGSSKAGQPFIRSVGNDFEPRAFDIFTPVAYAMIGEPWDTVLSRSIRIDMHRKSASDNLTDFEYEDAEPIFSSLGCKCARFARDNRASVHCAKPEMPPGVRNRSKDNWRPLLAIADLAGGDWPAIARSAAQHLLGHKETEEKSLGVRLLMDIRSVLTAASMSSSVLCNALADLEEAPWAEFGKKGKPINQRDLAKLLRAYGISTRDDRFGGSRVLKGYMRAMFDEAFDRYLPSIPSATPQHQPVTDIGGHAGMTTDVADGLMQMESVDPIRNTPNDQRGLSANVEGHAQENCCCVADQILQREHDVFDDSAAREVIYL